jgi:hypothetical protein
MCQSDFLDALEPALQEVAERGLGSAALGCPWIEHWIGYYRQRSPAEIEDALAQYAPDASEAATAGEAISAVISRVADGIASWTQTGQLTEGPADSPPQVAFKLASSPAGAAGGGDRGVARRVDPDAIRARLGQGRALDPGVRARMGMTIGADFSRVRIHDDSSSQMLTQSLGARAMTVGEHVAFAPRQYEPGTPLGDALIAHELAHVVQQQGGEELGRSSAPSDSRLEAEADSAAGNALQVLHGGPPQPRGLRPALRAGLQLQRCKSPAPAAAKDAGAPAKPPAPPPVFDAAGAASQPAAHAALEAYRKLSPADRRVQFDAAYKAKLLAPVLKALGADEASSKFPDEVRELLMWVQEEETRAFSGKSDAQMADEEAKWVYAKNKKEAEKKSGGKPVTDVDIAKETKEQQEKQSYHHPMPKTRYDSLTAKQKTDWDARAAKAIAAMVAYANAHHPEVKINAASLVWDPNAIDGNAPGAFAQGRGAGTASVGFEFVEAVETDPAYAMSTVVHELFGHPEFDAPGGNYHLRLFQQAAAKIPGYVSNPDAEETSYGYHESEIYSLVRERPYWTAVSAADAKKHPVVASSDYDPGQGMGWQLDAIISEWEPSLAKAIIHGLYKRFEMDPRVVPVGLNAFSDQIKLKFPADHAAIVK